MHTHTNTYIYMVYPSSFNFLPVTTDADEILI